MGRLRDDREAEYFCSIAQEVTDLFGTDDATLYRFSAREDENLAGKDPLWDEPSETVGTAFYKPFDLPVMWFSWASNILTVAPMGREEEIDVIAHVTVNHLKQAGVVPDVDGEWIAPGDTLAIHTKCGHETLEYDILQTNREGWINSSDKFVYYELTLKRRAKYEPERKTQP